MDTAEPSPARRARRPYWLIALAAVVIVLLVAGFIFAARGQAAPQQPMPFPHVTMVQVGINCLYCHSGADRSPAAGMPSVQKCMGCHQVIAKDRPAIQQLTSYWQKQEPIPWARVNRLPRFVYFSHQVHVVAGGFNCERCHGDVGHMREAQPVVRMNMGWCLNCHQKQPNAPQLRDCLVCHQ